MIPYSLLYPITNTRRSAVRLDGLWRFQFDPESRGMGEKWQEHGLPDSISMAVPGSFSEVFTETEERDYCGDFWYETEVYPVWQCDQPLPGLLQWCSGGRA